MALILGSQSPSRRLVLEKAGYDFTIKPADIDEKAIRDTDYERLPQLIAHAKANALVERLGNLAGTLLITSDQVVVCSGELREKPESPEEARRFLTSYRTEPAQTNSAVVVTNLETGKRADGLDVAMTYFAPMPNHVMATLATDEGILNSAGAFLIEHPVMKTYVAGIEGTPDSVMGLPLELTQRLMEEVR